MINYCYSLLSHTVYLYIICISNHQHPLNRCPLQVSAGSEHTCGTTATFKLWCWGSDGYKRVSGMPGADCTGGRCKSCLSSGSEEWLQVWPPAISDALCAVLSCSLYNVITEYVYWCLYDMIISFACPTLSHSTRTLIQSQSASPTIHIPPLHPHHSVSAL